MSARNGGDAEPGHKYGSLLLPMRLHSLQDELSHQFASDLPAKAREGFHACSGPKNGMCAIEDIVEVEKKCNRN